MTYDLTHLPICKIDRENYLLPTYKLPTYYKYIYGRESWHVLHMFNKYYIWVHSKLLIIFSYLFQKNLYFEELQKLQNTSTTQHLSTA